MTFENSQKVLFKVSIKQEGKQILDLQYSQAFEVLNTKPSISKENSLIKHNYFYNCK